MKAIDIYSLLDAIGDDEESIIIPGRNFFKFSLELENLGVDYEFSEFSLSRFESQFKDNVEFYQNELKIHFTHDFKDTIRLLNQNSNYSLSDHDVKDLWSRATK